MQPDLAGMLEQIAQDRLFAQELLLVVAALEVATAACAIFRAWWLDAVGRGLKDPGCGCLGKALFLRKDSGRDGFSRQDMPEQDDLAIFPAGQSVSAIDYFFNLERGVAHFFNDVRVEEMVFYLQRVNCCQQSAFLPAWLADFELKIESRQFL